MVILISFQPFQECLFSSRSFWVTVFKLTSNIINGGCIIMIADNLRHLMAKIWGPQYVPCCIYQLKKYIDAANNKKGGGQGKAGARENSKNTASRQNAWKRQQYSHGHFVGRWIFLPIAVPLHSVPALCREEAGLGEGGSGTLAQVDPLFFCGLEEFLFFFFFSTFPPESTIYLFRHTEYQKKRSTSDGKRCISVFKTPYNQYVTVVKSYKQWNDMIRKTFL